MKYLEERGGDYGTELQSNTHRGRALGLPEVQLKLISHPRLSFLDNPLIGVELGLQHLAARDFLSGSMIQVLAAILTKQFNRATANDMLDLRPYTLT